LKKISFTPHAVDRMSFWQVSEERVRRALLAPDRVRQGTRPERKVAQSRLANEALPVHVVYTAELEDEYVVITVYRGRPRKGD
jgi:hypothetical protein